MELNIILGIIAVMVILVFFKFVRRRKRLRKNWLDFERVVEEDGKRKVCLVSENKQTGMKTPCCRDNQQLILEKRKMEMMK